MGKWKSKVWQRSKIERNLLTWSWRWRKTRKPSKTRERNWKFRWTQPCLARWEQKGAQRSLRQLMQEGSQNPTERQKCACIVETHESARKRLEPTLPRKHEDHTAERGFKSMNHYHLVHKFIPMPQAMNILDAKAAVDKEVEKPKSCQRGVWRKWKARKR